MSYDASNFPDFRKLAPGNEPLPDSAIVPLQSALSQAKYSISDLDLQISKLQALRASHQRFVADQEPLLLPLRRIPPEILSEIFLLCSISRVCLPHPNVAPWNVSRVCRRWRTAALSTTALWRCFSIPTSSLHHNAPLINELLLRSGSRIDLDFHCWIQPTHPNMLPALKLLASHSDRWKDIELYLHHSALPITERLRGRLPNLQSCRLAISFDPDESRNRIFTAFEDAPGLNDVTLELESCRAATLTEAVKLPWTQLTRLAVEMKHSIETVIEILTICPQLLNLRLSDDTWSPYDKMFTIRADLPVFPRLRYLYTQYSGMIPAASFPNLQRYCSTDFFPEHYDTLREFGLLCSSNIHSLSLHIVEPYMSPDGFIPMLSSPAFKNLEELHLEATSEGFEDGTCDEFINAFVQVLQDEETLSRLHAVHVEYNLMGEEEHEILSIDKNFVEMLANRWDGAPCFFSFGIKATDCSLSFPLLNSHERRRLAILGGQVGMELSLWYQTTTGPDAGVPVPLF